MDASLSTLRKWGMDMLCPVGQGYDGGYIMSSSQNGVQAKVATQYPNAT